MKREPKTKNEENAYRKKKYRLWYYDCHRQVKWNISFGGSDNDESYKQNCNLHATPNIILHTFERECECECECVFCRQIERTPNTGGGRGRTKIERKVERKGKNRNRPKGKNNKNNIVCD